MHIHLYANYTLTGLPAWSLTISQINFPKVQDCEPGSHLCPCRIVCDFSYWIHNEQNRFKALHSGRKSLAECVLTEHYVDWHLPGTLSYVTSLIPETWERYKYMLNGGKPSRSHIIVYLRLFDGYKMVKWTEDWHFMAFGTTKRLLN